MNLTNFLMTTYTIALPIILGYIVWILKANKSKELERKKEEEARYLAEAAKSKAQCEGIMLVLRYMLRRYHTEYMFQKHISSDQLSDFEEIYKAYTALGGNSVAVKWHDDIAKLAINDNSNSTLTPIAKIVLESRSKANKQGQ